MTGSPPIRAFRLRAVTLLEVILAMGLLTMLTSSLYFFYGSSIDTRPADPVGACTPDSHG